MNDLKNTRRRTKAVELICEILKIDDNVLNAFINNGTLPKAEKNFAEKMKEAKAAKKAKEEEK